MLTESDKVTKTKYPPLPSKCCICNFSADGTREFLDFQVSLDIYGAVCICDACVAPVAELFGYVHHSLVTEVVESAEAAILLIEQQEVQIHGLQAALDSILVVRPDLNSGNPGNDDLASENSDEDDGQSTLGFEESGEDDSGTLEPDAGGRFENTRGSISGSLKL